VSYRLTIARSAEKEFGDFDKSLHILSIGHRREIYR